MVRRDNGKKIIVKIKDIKKEAKKNLDEMQKELYNNATKLLVSNIKRTENKKEMIKLIQEKKVAIVPICSSPKCEESIKTETNGAKALFIDPENTSVKNKKCIICSKPAEYWIYVGKTY